MSSHCRKSRLKKNGLSFTERREQSWCGTTVQIAKDRSLKNPQGRTGISHRGTLGLWGPNKAGDPIVVTKGARLNEVFSATPDSQKRLTEEYGKDFRFEDSAWYIRLIRRRDSS